MAQISPMVFIIPSNNKPFVVHKISSMLMYVHLYDRHQLLEVSLWGGLQVELEGIRQHHPEELNVSHG